MGTDTTWEHYGRNDPYAAVWVAWRFRSLASANPWWSWQPLESGALIRKGKVGAAHEDGMTPALAEEWRTFGSHILSGPDAMRWLYEGGPLP